ncbi:MAG TPA: hypothetical protein VI522_02275 [Gammaproteobacteria bacterium]|nr:hypothetical protein [Gammaproteobacteria bacterium]
MKISIDVESCGKAFAHESADEQSSCINNMGTELFVACKGERNFETQCCYISDKLDSGGKRLVKELYEFIKLREEQKT